MVRLNVEAMLALAARSCLAWWSAAAGGSYVRRCPGSCPSPPSHYAASKAFVLTFTESLTLDLDGTGVTATALCPGPVKTEFGGIIEGLPDRLYVDPERVAREAIDGLEAGDRTVIPGGGNKMNAVFGRHAPRGVFMAYAKRFWPS